MGAKIEGENYMPGYRTARDLNVDANGSWSPYYEEKTSSGQLCNGFVAKSPNRYSEYDKEMLRRTMLEHEAIFRQQVYELHRVYKIQRDLMKEYRSKDLYVYSVAADASHTNSLSSQMPPDSAKMIWQMQMPLADTACGKAPVAELNDTNPSFKFLREGSVQSSPNGVPSSDAVHKSRKNLFDLQLPADCYIDDENASANKPIDFFGVSSSANHRNGSKLPFGSGEGPRRPGGNSSILDLQTKINLRGQQVGDLNEPITGMYFGATTNSASGVPVDPKTYTLENSWCQPLAKTGTSYFGSHSDYTRDCNADEGTSSNFLDVNDRIRQENSTLDKDSGKRHGNMNFFAPKFSDAELQKFFKGTDARLTRNNQILYSESDTNNSVKWFPQRAMEAPGINNYPRYNHLHQPGVPLPAPFSIPHVNRPCSNSPLGSCSINPRSSIIHSTTFRAVPCFNASSAKNSYASPSVVTQSIDTSSHKLKNTENLNGFYPGFPLDSASASHRRQPIAVSSHLEQSNGPAFGHSSEQSQYGNGKCQMNFNLNEALPDGLEDVPAEQDQRCIDSLEHKGRGSDCLEHGGKGSVFGIPWLKNKVACADIVDSEKSMNAFGYLNGVALQLENKDGKEAALTLRNLSDSASTSRGCGFQIGEAPEDATTRILGVPFSNNTREGAKCLPVSSNEHTCLERSAAAEGIVKKSSTFVRNLIDLNDEVPNEDNSESSVVSHECHPASLQKGRAKPHLEIDLEAPVCEEEALAFLQEQTPCDKPDVSWEADDSFAIAAAKSIVAMSVDLATSADTAVSQSASQFDALQWFAEIATANSDCCAMQANTGVRNFHYSSDDGLDSFESLTLKLEETKIDEYWCRPRPPETKNDEQAVSAVLLLTKPRRGQQRRRRQKRDFQKDILPGLVSLSRHEVTEDLQLLDGLVRASGGSWQMSSARRGRNGGRTRGRKPRKNVAISVEEEIQASPPAKPDTANLEADGMGMIGWGRTTRRCRRSRCPPANNTAAS